MGERPGFDEEGEFGWVIGRGLWLMFLCWDGYGNFALGDIEW